MLTWITVSTSKRGRVSLLFNIQDVGIYTFSETSLRKVAPVGAVDIDNVDVVFVGAYFNNLAARLAK